MLDPGQISDRIFNGSFITPDRAKHWRMQQLKGGGHNLPLPLLSPPIILFFPPSSLLYFSLIRSIPALSMPRSPFSILHPVLFDLPSPPLPLLPHSSYGGLGSATVSSSSVVRGGSLPNNTFLTF